MDEVKVKVKFSNIFDEYLEKKEVRPESPFLPLLKMK
jgi:hypothetical protein